MSTTSHPAIAGRDLAVDLGMSLPAVFAGPPRPGSPSNIMLGLSNNWVIVLARRKLIVATKQTPIGNDKRSRNSAERPESAAQF
ncbi:hypothetical protein ACFQX9_07265 [Bradyrhizobium sp. GCM10028915]|jgi:hypothetical protein|uniref:hypothetical protein n=1 Tax=unclassified Bradyrhizobium TaxID=2631580 RepID=UPI003612EEC9